MNQDEVVVGEVGNGESSNPIWGDDLVDDDKGVMSKGFGKADDTHMSAATFRKLSTLNPTLLQHR